MSVGGKRVSAVGAYLSVGAGAFFAGAFLPFAGAALVAVALVARAFFGGGWEDVRDGGLWERMKG